MATYKLIQDIEAEDHILGPLTLRQFIFALLAAFQLYICFISVAKHVPVLLAVFLPPALFCAFFAFPFGGDQPTELWALAKLRFWFKPRRRVWNQSGIKELVTITVPKKVERVYTDGLSQGEVKSRLQALANTIDSRGWSVKHIDAVGYIPQQPPLDGSDRLISIPDIPQDVPGTPGTEPGDDIMDAETSPIAQQFDNMINKSTQNYRQRLVEQLRAPLPPETDAGASGQAGQPPQQWFMNHNPVAAPMAAMPQPSTIDVPTIDLPAVTAAQNDAAAADAALSAELKARSAPSAAYSHLRTLRPTEPTVPADGVPDGAAPGMADVAADAAAQMSDDVSTAMTASGDPAILSLSNNNDLNVATIAREAQRAKQSKDGGAQDEVVISLH